MFYCTVMLPRSVWVHVDDFRFTPGDAVEFGSISLSTVPSAYVGFCASAGSGASALDQHDLAHRAAADALDAGEPTAAMIPSTTGTASRSRSQ